MVLQGKNRNDHTNKDDADEAGDEEKHQGLGEGDMVVLTSNKPLTPGAAVRSTSPKE